MLVENVTYIDYNGEERTEPFYFNLTEADLAEMNFATEGGLQQLIKRIIDTNDVKTIAEIFKDILVKSNGKPSLDGRRFIRNDETRDEFVQSPAYSILYMRYSHDSKAAAKFINGIIPSSLKDNSNENKVIPMN